MPLEDVPTADLVKRTIAARLAVSDSGTRPILDRLADDLMQRSVLLLVDNMEHVHAAGSELAALLGRCPEWSCW